MIEKLDGNYFLNVSNLFDIEVLQLLFSKYMESSQILYIFHPIYILHSIHFSKYLRIALIKLSFGDKYSNIFG